MVVDGSAAVLPAVDLAAQEALVRLTPLVVVPAPGTAQRILDATLARIRTRYPQVPVSPASREPCLVVRPAAELPDALTEPLLVYRPTAAVPSAPVLVGVRDADGPRPVVEFAFAEAASYGAPLLAVHVSSGVHPSTDVLIEALAICREKYPQVPVRLAARHGLDAAVALSASSRAARLVVIGLPTRRRTGSVAAALLRRARCPVALVPTG